MVIEVRTSESPSRMTPSTRFSIEPGTEPRHEGAGRVSGSANLRVVGFAVSRDARRRGVFGTGGSRP